MKTTIKTITAVATASLLINSATAIVINPIPTYPSGERGVAVTEPFNLYATGGDVQVSYLGWAGAAYNEYLFLAAAVVPGASVTTLPKTGTQIFQDKSGPEGPVDLGNYAAGTELVFGLYVNNTGKTYYSGAGSRNDDGTVHLFGYNNYLTEGTTYMGFEDLPASNADDNYADLRFTVTGAASVLPKSVPDNDAGTFTLLLGAGMILVPWSLHARRQHRQANLQLLTVLK